jgi:anti-sigma B factor antagonist
MNPQSPHLEIRTEGGFTQATFFDAEIIQESLVRQLSDQLTPRIRSQPGIRLLLDFGHVQRLSSVALGMLTTLLIRVLAQQGQMRLAGLKPKVREELAVTKLDKVFDIHDTLDAAAAGFANT